MEICSEYGDYGISDLTDNQSDILEDVKWMAGIFKYSQNEIQLCKSHKKHHKTQAVEASQKGNIFGIITGLALIAIGTVVSLAAPTAGGIIVGVGVSMIGNAVTQEVNDASEKKDDPAKNEPPRPIEQKPRDIRGVLV